ncbi:MAG: hypothetical protein HY281_05225 [Nitrospirae bacterium]|nr:hypothetical protein [Nitrospirota bacterium]
MLDKSEQTGNLTSGLAALVLVSLLALGGCSHEVSVFSGLKPETPPARSDGCAAVTSRQPTLRWQAFLAAREAAESVPGASGITYELKIWMADHDAPGKLVYVREGLSEPSHIVQEPLSGATTYFWSIRARFLLNGVAPRVSDWGQQLRMNIMARDPKSGIATRDFIDHQYYQYYCFHMPTEAR